MFPETMIKLAVYMATKDNKKYNKKYSKMYWISISKSHH